MKMDSLMLSPRDGGPRESTLLSVALPLSEEVSGDLTHISKVGEGSGTVDKHLERFRSSKINSGYFHN